MEECRNVERVNVSYHHLIQIYAVAFYMTQYDKQRPSQT